MEPTLRKECSNRHTVYLNMHTHTKWMWRSILWLHDFTSSLPSRSNYQWYHIRPYVKLAFFPLSVWRQCDTTCLRMGFIPFHIVLSFCIHFHELLSPKRAQKITIKSRHWLQSTHKKKSRTCRWIVNYVYRCRLYNERALLLNFSMQFNRLH